MELANDVHRREGKFLKIMGQSGGKEGGASRQGGAEAGNSAESWHLSPLKIFFRSTLSKPSPDLVGSFSSSFCFVV